MEKISQFLSDRGSWLSDFEWIFGYHPPMLLYTTELKMFFEALYAWFCRTANTDHSNFSLLRPVSGDRFLLGYNAQRQVVDSFNDGDRGLLVRVLPSICLIFKW